MSFLSPLLLGGLALAAVPLIIHLLNRRRFQVVDWAPMHYLKLTLKTHRRRMKLEQLLLLLVRMLMVALLMLAVARPVISRNGVGAWLAVQTRTSHVIVLDDSLSMGYRGPTGTAFARAKTAVTDFLATVGSQDTVTIVLTSSPRTPLVREVKIDDRAKLLRAVGSLNVTDTASDWPATLRDADSLLATTTLPTRRLTIITDFRRSGWNDHVASIVGAWDPRTVAIHMIDVGERKTDNTVLVALEQEAPAVVLAGAVANLTATIRNDTPGVLAPAQAVLTYADQSRPVMLPQLAPGESVRVPLAVTFAKPGRQVVQLALPDDALPGDNRRWLALDVRERLEVVMVDGQPSDRPFESTTDFLLLAFTVGGDAWHVTRLTDMEGLSGALAHADAVVLANVADPSVRQIEALEKAVRGGVGLMIFCGDQVDPAIYNERLHRGGAGLLPLPLTEPRDETVSGMTIERFDQSSLAPLARVAAAALARVRATRTMGLGISDPLPEGVRILARWGDASPAAVEKTVGKGHVLLWTITADKRWSPWPVEPTYVLAMRSALMGIARPSSGNSQNIVGQPIVQEFTADDAQPIEPTIRTPTADEPAALLIGSRADKNGGATLLPFDRTASTGVYIMEWKEKSTGVARREFFAVNPDAAESDLAPLEERELRQWMGAVPLTIEHPAVAAPPTDQGREVWRTFAWVMMGMLAVETVLATWVGRDR